MSRFSLDPPDEDAWEPQTPKCATLGCENPASPDGTLCNFCHVLMNERREQRIRESNEEIYLRAARNNFGARKCR